MANEITINISGTLSNSPLQRTFVPAAAQITQVTKRRAGSAQSLTSAWEAVALGDLTAGYVFLTNLDDTFSVDFGPLEAGSGGDGVLCGTLRPSDPPALIPVPSGVTLMVRASGGSGATATVDIEAWSQ